MMEEKKGTKIYFLRNIYSRRVSQNALRCIIEGPMSPTLGFKAAYFSLNDPGSFDQLGKRKQWLNSAHKHLSLGLLFLGFLQYGWHSANFLWKSCALWVWNAATHDQYHEERCLNV